MINIREEDKHKYGEEVYHHFRRQGNHRWDTFVYRNERDIYTVIFRHSYNKKFPDGVKRSQIRDEKIIMAKGIINLRDADYPEYKDVDILKESAFYKSRVEGDVDER
ncbi:antirestriction protein ArdR [Escherichia coli]|nr:antirestriction protein ArdR [Escherichia coli]